MSKKPKYIGALNAFSDVEMPRSHMYDGEMGGDSPSLENEASYALTVRKKHKNMSMFCTGPHCPGCGHYIEPIPISEEVLTSAPAQFFIECQNCLRRYRVTAKVDIIGEVEGRNKLII